jgi:hypothetical protein
MHCSLQVAVGTSPAPRFVTRWAPIPPLPPPPPPPKRFACSRGARRREQKGAEPFSNIGEICRPVVEFSPSEEGTPLRLLLGVAS